MVSSKSMRSVANFTTASRLHSVASRLSLPLGPSVRTGYLTSIGTSTANGDEEGSRTEVSNSKQRRRARRAQASTGEHRRAQTSAKEHAVVRRESSKRLLWLYSTSLFLFLPSALFPLFVSVRVRLPRFAVVSNSSLFLLLPLRSFRFSSVLVAVLRCSPAAGPAFSCVHAARLLARRPRESAPHEAERQKGAAAAGSISPSLTISSRPCRKIRDTRKSISTVVAPSSPGRKTYYRSLRNVRPSSLASSSAARRELASLSPGGGQRSRDTEQSRRFRTMAVLNSNFTFDACTRATNVDRAIKRPRCTERNTSIRSPRESS